jgi:hypothetical protein
MQDSGNKRRIAMHDDAQHSRTGSSSYSIKKCPECYTYLPLRTTKCPSCNTKLGDVDKLGFASRTFDWVGYLTAILIIIALVCFVWWGFFSD